MIDSVNSASHITATKWLSVCSVRVRARLRLNYLKRAGSRIKVIAVETGKRLQKSWPEEQRYWWELVPDGGREAEWAWRRPAACFVLPARKSVILSYVEKQNLRLQEQLNFSHPRRTCFESVLVKGWNWCERFWGRGGSAIKQDAPPVVF